MLGVGCIKTQEETQLGDMQTNMISVLQRGMQETENNGLSAPALDILKIVYEIS